MRVLISGAGVAGPTLAYWLSRYGFQPTLMRKRQGCGQAATLSISGARATTSRTVWRLLPEISSTGYVIREVRVVDRSGRRSIRISSRGFRRLTEGRYSSLPRGDLAAAIFGRLDGKVEMIFGDSVTRIEQTERNAIVGFEHGAAREFDLVVGADGLHSRVRELVFGPARPI